MKATEVSYCCDCGVVIYFASAAWQFNIQLSVYRGNLCAATAMLNDLLGKAAQYIPIEVKVDSIKPRYLTVTGNSVLDQYDDVLMHLRSASPKGDNIISDAARIAKNRIAGPSVETLLSSLEELRKHIDAALAVEVIL
jgi:hypothetical protein